MQARTSHRSPWLAFTLLVLSTWVTVGCTGSNAGSRAATSRPTPPPGDSLALADSARRTCGPVHYESKQHCYSSLLDSFVTTYGVRVAMGVLDRLGTKDEYVHSEGGHVLAHGIGITAGKANGDLAHTFAECTEIFQSGCYHGVLQAYFERVHTIDTSVVNAMCAPWQTPTFDPWLYFQCIHGMGHGLTMFYAHDLRHALESCDLLYEKWDRESCYGGAFMENVVNVVSPHHPAAALRVGAAGPQHTHGEMAATAADQPAFKPMDPHDMQYPCSALAERYLSQCYQMQTSVMLYYNHGDIAAAARLCKQAPGVMRYVCHESLGRDAVAYANDDISETIRLCSLADPEYQPWCHFGAAANFIDVTAKVDDGLRYCRAVPGDRNKALCYNSIGDQISTLRATRVDRETMCGKVDAAWRDMCRYGAQLDPVPPARLPTPKGG